MRVQQATAIKMQIKTLSLSVLLLTACGGEIEVDIENYPQPDSIGASVYIESCSGCHVPPQPADYSTHEWDVIVTRMQQRRMDKRMPRVTNEKLELMMDYLQRHARQS